MSETAGLRRGLRVLTLVASVAIVVMLVLAVISGWRSRQAATDRGRHLDPAATTTALLLAGYVDQESALRGYIVTRDRGFLAPFDVSDRVIPTLTARLDELLTDFPELRAQRARIGTAYATWRREVVRPELAAMSRGDVAGAADIVRESARRDFDRLRSAVAKLATGIDREQVQASQQLETAAVLLLSSLASAMVIILVVLATVLTASRRWLLRPIGALQRSVNAVAAGRYDTRIPSVGPAEIVALAADVETMRAQLVRLVRQNERSFEALAQQGPAVIALRDALTPSVLRARDVVLHGRVDPAQGELAGDWYDALDLPDGRVAVIVGDVSGHGAAAGVFALRLKQLLDAALTNGGPLATVPEWVVDNLGDTDEMFATAIILVIDPRTGELHYVNAGHPDTLLLRRPGPALTPTYPSRAPQQTPALHPAPASRPEPVRDPSSTAVTVPAAPGSSQPPSPARQGEPEASVGRTARPIVDVERAEAAGVEAAGVEAGRVEAEGGGGQVHRQAKGTVFGAVSRAAQIVRLPPTGPLMSSLVAVPGAWQRGTIHLEPGDVLIAYTDGLVEARDAGGRQFGVHRLIAEVLRDPTRDPVALLDGAFDAVRRHAPGQQDDDRTAIILAWSNQRVTGAAVKADTGA
ncbi:PP2C family protein-serine/threonine phosphatase [Frankia sp. AiPa1]|uniref:PP2C family protein-serine/threonine phosphatase n=1 Tax=Frankia sp. AiPa1 TaxID=573492 RepID=UPI00202B907B|nr:SpoIIE family protein phosphatase [Frankia sp. AiPa1]MCL9761827.1 SpoIIE family protein phosphatase [Frankia sp. AiPa1]